jgi:hypothetical protein
LSDRLSEQHDEVVTLLAQLKTARLRINEGNEALSETKICTFEEWRDAKHPLWFNLPMRDQHFRTAWEAATGVAYLRAVQICKDKKSKGNFEDYNNGCDGCVKAILSLKTEVK